MDAPKIELILKYLVLNLSLNQWKNTSMVMASEIEGSKDITCSAVGHKHTKAWLFFLQSMVLSYYGTISTNTAGKDYFLPLKYLLKSEEKNQTLH